MIHDVLKQVTERLKAHQYSITCAESCTGGLLASALTEYAGSSAWFNMGFVTYSNQAKQQLLDVSEQTLRDHGAVSAATVIEMANGARTAAAADFALSISGIAGPSGGSMTKPVGTVWFGLAHPNGETLAKMRLLNGNRAQIREQATLFALTWLTEVLQDVHSY